MNLLNYLFLKVLKYLLLPDDPELPLEPEDPEVPVDPDDPLLPEKPELPLVPEEPLDPVLPLVPDDPLVPVDPERHDEEKQEATRCDVKVTLWDMFNIFYVFAYYFVEYDPESCHIDDTETNHTAKRSM